MLGYHTLPEQAPARADNPQEQAPPLGAGMPPTCAVHAGRYGQQAGGMHPTGMQSCWLHNFADNLDFMSIRKKVQIKWT